MKDPTFLSILMSGLRLGPKSQHQRRSSKDVQPIAVISRTDQILTHEWLISQRLGRRMEPDGVTMKRRETDYRRLEPNFAHPETGFTLVEVKQRGKGIRKINKR